MKILFLLPPSEGKNAGGEYSEEQLNYIFEKPLQIAEKATEKDLKCRDKRYYEGIEFNKNLNKGPFEKAINRYSGVMYNAIDYHGMTREGQQFFSDNFGILSGIYGLLKPLDIIGNYKLPIETKGLYKFWGNQITNKLNELSPEYIVNLLPGSYTKMINFSEIHSKIINVNFLKEKDGKIVKISHGVKKIKGEWIKNICEAEEKVFNNFGGKVVKMGKNIEINIL